MNGSLSCGRCGSRNIRHIHTSDADHPLGIGQDELWQCANCGESCRDPAKTAPASPRLDFTMGITVLASLFLMFVHMMR